MRRRRQLGGKVKPGDGSAQPELRFTDALSRTLMLTTVEDDDGTRHRYGVAVDFLSEREDARLYRDGVQVAVAALPAAFPVPGGRIEVATSLYGLKRAHLVWADGSQEPLRPAANSAEYWRARFARRHPFGSRVVGVLAAVVLLVGVAVAVPQLLELVTGLEVLDGYVPEFESPVSLPGWANTTLLVAGLVAGVERALTLRNHWLVDLDTWFLGD